MEMVKKEGKLFEIIKRVSRKYWLVLLEDKLLADVVFKIDRYDLEEVLREFFKSGNRSFSIQIVPDQSIWKPSTLDINTRQLMKSGMITVEIVVVVDESQVDILCCKIVMIKTTSYLYEGTVGELISMISSDTGEVRKRERSVKSGFLTAPQWGQEVCPAKGVQSVRWKSLCSV